MKLDKSFEVIQDHIIDQQLDDNAAHLFCLGIIDNGVNDDKLMFKPDAYQDAWTYLKRFITCKEDTVRVAFLNIDVRIRKMKEIK